MKHISIYEDFSNIPAIARDMFDLEFELVLKNRTIIRGMKYSEAEVKELFNERIQYKLINECYPLATQYTLDIQEVKRAECAEKNIREYIGDKLDDLDCEIIYYRPMRIESSWNGKITAYAPGANWGSGNELKIEGVNRSSEEGKKKMPEIISMVKEFAKKYGVTHVLPYGPVIVRYPLRSEFSNSFIPIEKFDWERYYW